MLTGNLLSTAVFCFVFVACVIFTGKHAQAEQFTAGTVMDRMPHEERAAYVAGVIEGLAYARYAAEDKTTEGMGCIYRWYYDDAGAALGKIEAAFARFREHTPGAIIGALLKKGCP